MLELSDLFVPLGEETFKAIIVYQMPKAAERKISKVPKKTATHSQLTLIGALEIWIMGWPRAKKRMESGSSRRRLCLMNYESKNFPITTLKIP